MTTKLVWHLESRSEIPMTEQQHRAHQLGFDYRLGLDSDGQYSREELLIALYERAYTPEELARRTSTAEVLRRENWPLD